MNEIFLGRGQRDNFICPTRIINHGIICGSSNSGKMAAAKLLIEGLFDNGVKIFGFDVSGELSNLSQPARIERRIAERAKTVGLTSYEPGFLPVHFWHEDESCGDKLRLSAGSLGPELLGQLLGLGMRFVDKLRVDFAKCDTDGFAPARLVDIPTQEESIRSRFIKFSDKHTQDFFSPGSLGLDQMLLKLPRYGSPCEVVNMEKLAWVPNLYPVLAAWFLATLIEISNSAERRVVIFDAAEILFEKSLLNTEFLRLLELATHKNIGVVFISNTLADIPLVLREHISLFIHCGLRGRSKRELEGIEVAAAEMPLEKMDLRKAVKELQEGEALYLANDTLSGRQFAEWMLMPPARSRDEKITEGELKLISTNRLEQLGISKPYEDASLVKERIRQASSLSLTSLGVEEEPTKSSAQNPINRGILGVRIN